MATLGYGMYGFNVLNANGETDSLPFVRFTGITSQLGNISVAFNSVDSDEYRMAIPNQSTSSGTFSAGRTPVAGLYEIELDLIAISGAATGVSQIEMIIDKQSVFDSSGLFVAAGSGLGYTLCQHRVSITSASTNGSHALKKTIFLEKDCYISLSHTTTSGTTTALATTTFGYFLIRCISTENSGKTVYQTS